MAGLKGAADKYPHNSGSLSGKLPRKSQPFPTGPTNAWIAITYRELWYNLF